jgi:hypothetical protein
LFAPRITVDVNDMVSTSRIRPFEIVRGLFLGELTLRSSLAQLSKGSITMSSSVIAFILTIPTLVFLAEFAHNHTLHGRALVYEILGLVIGPLSLVVLPTMSNLIQSLPATFGSDPPLHWQDNLLANCRQIPLCGLWNVNYWWGIIQCLILQSMLSCYTTPSRPVEFVDGFFNFRKLAARPVVPRPRIYSGPEANQRLPVSSSWVILFLFPATLYSLLNTINS